MGTLNSARSIDGIKSFGNGAEREFKEATLQKQSKDYSFYKKKSSLPW